MPAGNETRKPATDQHGHTQIFEICPWVTAKRQSTQSRVFFKYYVYLVAANFSVETVCFCKTQGGLGDFSTTMIFSQVCTVCCVQVGETEFGAVAFLPAVFFVVQNSTFIIIYTMVKLLLNCSAAAAGYCYTSELLH